MKGRVDLLLFYNDRFCKHLSDSAGWVLRWQILLEWQINMHI
jgi:hypothetical protein